MTDYNLMLGDCIEQMASIPAGSVDLVLTDPPYGIAFAAQPTKWQRRDGKVAEDWDNAPAPDWLMGLMREKAGTLIV